MMTYAEDDAIFLIKAPHGMRYNHMTSVSRPSNISDKYHDWESKKYLILWIRFSLDAISSAPFNVAFLKMIPQLNSTRDIFCNFVSS